MRQRTETERRKTGWFKRKGFVFFSSKLHRSEATYNYRCTFNLLTTRSYLYLNTFNLKKALSGTEEDSHISSWFNSTSTQIYDICM